MGNFKIGWAEESITPDKKIKLAGQFFERISEYAETPVTVTAMAVESCGENVKDAMLICSCDLCFIETDLITKVKELLEGKVIGLPLDKIIISATHTHTSHLYQSRGIDSLSNTSVLKRYLPELKYDEEEKIYNGTYGSDEVMTGEEAFLYLAAQIANSIANAWNSRNESYYSNQFGRAPIGMCRRVCYDDGSAKMWGDTNSINFTELEGGNDSGIELLYTFNETKKLSGVVINIACPSQVVEHRSFISSDYWGKVKILLREKFGNELYVLGLCSPAGDQCPRDMIRWQNPETPIDDPNIKRENYIERNADPSMFDIKGSWKVGKRIADEIIDVYDEISEIKDCLIFKHKCLRLDLPIRKVTEEDYNNSITALENYVRNNKKEEFNFEDNAKMHEYAGIVARYELQQSKEIQSIEIHVVRWDDIAIATNPFELFLDYGNRMRARSKARQTFLIQLACGSEMYLPTEKAERGSHYSAYVSSGIIGHEGGELLTEATVETINNFW